MWNFDAKKMIDEFKKELEEHKKWQSDTKEKIKDLQTQIANLSLSQKNIFPAELSPNQEARLKELELWQSKLHSLMIEKTPSGTKEKLHRNYNFLRGKI